jgi:hypothetical protein
LLLRFILTFNPLVTGPIPVQPTKYKGFPMEAFFLGVYKVYGLVVIAIFAPLRIPNPQAPRSNRGRGTNNKGFPMEAFVIGL